MSMYILPAFMLMRVWSCSRKKDFKAEVATNAVIKGAADNEYVWLHFVVGLHMILIRD